MSSEATVLIDVPSHAKEEARTKDKRRFIDRLLIPSTSLLVLLYAIPIVSFPAGRDQGTYLQIGQSLLDGKHLYLQLWDNKPPGIFLVYAGIAKLFGRVMWSPALVDFLLLLSISFLLFRFVERYLGRWGASIAVLVNVYWSSERWYWWIAQPETFQELCILACLLLLLSAQMRWKVNYLLAGGLCGLGFWQKYNFIAFLPLLLLFPFLSWDALAEQPSRFALNISWQGWLRRVAWLSFGFGIIVAAVIVWIVLGGGWPAMRESQFEVLPRYAAMAVQREPHYFITAIVKTYLFIGPTNVFAALATLLIGLFTRDLKRMLPMALPAGVALTSTVMQMRFHGYYFQICFPFFAALWAYLTVRLYEGTKAAAGWLNHKGRPLAAALLWLLFANVLFWPLPHQMTYLALRYAEFLRWRENPQVFYANYPGQLPMELLDGQLEVMKYVSNNTAPKDSIYVWGSNTLIYFLTDRQCPTRFVLNLGVVAQWGQPSWKQEILRDVRAAQPRLIIVTKGDALPTITYEDMDSAEYLRNKFLDFDRYIAANYTIAQELPNFTIYRRN